MRRDFKRLSRALLIGASTSALATFVLAGPSSAQDATPPAADSGGIETVVVTAEKRSENAQDVGMSISAFSGDQLENANITSMTEPQHFPGEQQPQHLDHHPQHRFVWHQSRH